MHVLVPDDMLAVARFYDEVIVTTLTAGQENTLPIWILGELVRPRQRPVTNVVAVFVIAVTLVPILVAYRVTRGTETVAGGGSRAISNLPSRPLMPPRLEEVIEMHTAVLDGSVLRKSTS